MLTTTTKYRPVTLSLFSGAGGLDIGFHQTGFDIVSCVEIESTFCSTLEMNRGKYLGNNAVLLNKDITQLEPGTLPVVDLDFIIGGPPCQSFSAIGRRAGGIDGTGNQRGSLFEHYCRFVRHFQPKGFLFENVRGILGSNGGRDWKLIEEAFGALGYHLFYRVLDCADYGVPQHRERLLMVGLREGSFRFPRPTHGPDSLAGAPHITAHQAIVDLQDPNEPMNTYSGKYGHLLEQVPPGMNYHYFTKELGHPNPVFAWRSRFSDFLYKADPAKPVRTVVAQLGAYSGPFHWKNRKFTVSEFMRLQSFPDDYQFAGSPNVVHRQIGNSVPPRLGTRLAEAVLQQVFGIPLGVKLIEETDKLSFDARKSTKARSTRSRRQLPIAQPRQYQLFDEEQPVTETLVVGHQEEHYYRYPTVRQRLELNNPPTTLGDSSYKVTSVRTGDRYEIYVQHFEGNEPVGLPLIRYDLRFHFPVGDGIREIACVLASPNESDIAVAWDAIEDVLASSSGYGSMIDVFGHFTEPHPIFDLNMEILVPKPGFIARFAKCFSDFRATTQVFPSQHLSEIYDKGSHSAFNFSRVARMLRELRFDVRVNETNTTIAPGFFRCCYPFTVSLRRQVAVRWTERNPEVVTNGQHELPL